MKYLNLVVLLDFLVAGAQKWYFLMNCNFTQIGIIHITLVIGAIQIILTVNILRIFSNLYIPWVNVISILIVFPI